MENLNCSTNWPGFIGVDHLADGQNSTSKVKYQDNYWI